MKRNKRFGFIILLILLSLEISNVYSVPVLIFDNAEDQAIYGHAYGTRTFYSNYTKRFYIFSDLESDGISYSTSWDGKKWSSWKDLITHLDPISIDPELHDFWLERNGRYIHYAEIWTYPSPNHLLYRKGELLKNGNINWLEDVQFVTNGVELGGREPIGGVSICTDSQGWVFIAFTGYKAVASPYFPYCYVNNRTDGIWNTYYYDTFNWGWNPDDDWINKNKVLPINNTMLWLCVCFDVGNNLADCYSNEWSGTGWYVGKAIWWDTAWTGNPQRRWEAVSYGNNAICAYNIRSGGRQRLYTKEFHYYGGNIGSWGNTTEHGNYDESFGYPMPHLSSNQEGNITLLWGTNTDRSLVEVRKRWSNHTWQTKYNIYDYDWDMFWTHTYFSTTEYTYSPLGVWFQDFSNITDLYYDTLWENITLPFDFINVTIYNSDGSINNGWLFQGEVYDIVSYVINSTMFWLNFTDGRNEVRFIYDRNNREMYAETDRENVIGILYTQNLTYSGDIYRLTWRFVLGINILDNIEIMIEYYIYNEEFDDFFVGDTGLEINIYNLGEKVYYTFSGDAGKVVGGHPYEIYATNSSIPGGSFAYAYVLKRKWQHFHTLFSWDFGDHECPDHDEETGKVQFGIQYLNGTSWTSSFRVNLYVIAGTVNAPFLGFGGKNWVKIRVDWSNYDAMGYYSVIKSDYITAWYDGGPNKENRTTVRLFVDMWISSLNQSTVVAGRVNSYYYGMNQTGFLLWQNWKPYITSTEVSTFYDDFRNPLGNTISSLDIELIRHWCLLQKLVDLGSGEMGDENCDTHTWTVKGFTELHHKVADDRYLGIDAPPYEETKVIDMPQSGFLAVIFKALSSLGTVIWMGALKFVRTLWSAMDQILEWMGLPSGLFSRIMEFILSIPQLFIVLLNQIGFMITYSIQIILDMFTVIGLMIYRILYFSGMFVNMIVSYYNQIVSLFTGGWENIRNLWDMFDLQLWIEFFLIGIFPLWEFYRITNAKDPLEQLKKDVEFFWGIISGIFGIFKMFLDLIKSIIGAIRDVSPI